MRVLLVSTYDLGRQPFGLASPAAWLRRAGVEAECADTSREPLDDGRLAAASVVAFYLPMHTATRLAAPLIDRARRVNPGARLCAYGLYAPLNAEWLREQGIHEVLGPEAEEDLVQLVKTLDEARGANPVGIAQASLTRLAPPRASTLSGGIARLPFIQPDRAGLPALSRYASLQMPDGSRRVIGTTDATRGCKHLCRHCPIVPVYRGQFRAVPLEVVLGDITAQVEAGAQHITFGDPDFLNGPTHARRLVERLARECPGVSYDVTIKIEHLLRHADLLPVLRDTGCLFITSAVESIDDHVLGRLRKGHTRNDFIRAAALCREAGVLLAPTFVPFTPWTTVEGYVELLDLVDELDLVEQVAPIQLAIRLLITSGSPLLELPDIRRAIGLFDPASLTWPWRHPDANVDAVQRDVMQIVGAARGATRSEVFAAIASAACERAGAPARTYPSRSPRAVPSISEPWYCCAEPSPEQMGAI
ncbi:MAG: radical SAM protein [Acidobacteria bacterium]|nr:radical SAM protein [Acidobacteriota bacterium]